MGKRSEVIDEQVELEASGAEAIEDGQYMDSYDA
jgi:hypothetical protein